jgi:hypothetical protein
MEIVIKHPTKNGFEALIDDMNSDGTYAVSFWVDGNCLHGNYKYKTLKGAKKKAEQIKNK